MASDVNPISAGIQLGGQVLGLGLNLLAQHTARLKGAKNENQALDEVIPAFDSDLKEVVAAYNNGEATRDECIQALYNVDSQVFKYLMSLVGPPGTAWGGPKNLGTQINASYHATCDKLCTASCCVYLNDLRPAIFGRSGLGSAYAPYQTSSGVAGGLVEAIQRGSGTVKVIPVAKPTNTAYGNYERPTYNLVIKKPSKVASASGTINKTVATLLGQTSTSSPLANLGVESSSPLSSFGLGGGGGQQNMLMIVLVFLGLLLGVSVLQRS